MQRSREVIVAELLKKEAISTEDAAKLLEKEYIYVNTYIPTPNNVPYVPNQPYWSILPYQGGTYSGVFGTPTFTANNSVNNN